ncbi:MAG: hypothetical protein A2231_05505 [Candidatus Firestonebacteria bacterium RIFOXYA2_FULL_40_8]|nr:MAG: hypothetical protein A2231_05505 [Candidatus Firestonebacteria bacterium RIFOXYA2_FULL_40_8]
MRVKKIAAILIGMTLFFGSALNAAEKAGKAVKAVKAEKTEKTEEAADSKAKKGDRMDLIKFDKGEMGGESNDSVVFSLAKEHVEKGKMYSCKMVFKKKDTAEGTKWVPYLRFVGVKGKRSNWKDYDTVNIKYFVAGDKPLTFGLIFTDAQTTKNMQYGSYCSQSVTFQPGEGVASIDITGLQTNGGGRSMDLETMGGIGGGMTTNREEDQTVFIQSIYLEKE